MCPDEMILYRKQEAWLLTSPIHCHYTGSRKHDSIKVHSLTDELMLHGKPEAWLLPKPIHWYYTGSRRHDFYQSPFTDATQEARGMTFTKAHSLMLHRKPEAWLFLPKPIHWCCTGSKRHDFYESPFTDFTQEAGGMRFVIACSLTLHWKQEAWLLPSSTF